MTEERDCVERNPRLERNLRALRGFSFFTYPLAAIPLLWFFYQERGLGLGDYGFLVAVGYASMVALELPTGWLADRIGRKRPMLLGPLFFGCGWFTTWASTSIPGYAAGQILISLGHSLMSGPPSALLYEYLHEHDLHSDYLREEAAQWRRVILGSSLSFFVGGCLGQLVSYDAAVVATGFLCWGAIPFAAALDESTRESSPPEHSESHQEPSDSSLRRLGTALRHPEVLWLVLLYVLLFFLLRYSFHTWQPWLDVVEHDGFDVGAPFFVGGLYAALSFFSLPFVRWTPRLNQLFGDEGILLLCCGVCAAALVGLSFGTYVWLLPLLFVQQIPFALHRPLAHAYANHRIASRDRALVLSTLSFAGRLGFAVTIALVLDDDTVVRDDYFSVGLICLGITTALTLFCPRKRRG